MWISFKVFVRKKCHTKFSFERNPASFFLKLQGHQISEGRKMESCQVQFILRRFERRNEILSENFSDKKSYLFTLNQSKLRLLVKSAWVERNILRPNLSFTNNMWWPERSQTIYLKLKNEVFWKELDRKFSQVIYLYQQPTIWRRWYWPRAKSFPLSNCGSTKNGDLQVTDGSKAIRKV